MSVGTDAGARADRRQHGAQAGHGDGGGSGGLSAEDRRPARGPLATCAEDLPPLRRDRQHVYAQRLRRPGQAHGRGPPRRGTTPPQGGERAGGARDLGGEFTGEPVASTPRGSRVNSPRPVCCSRVRNVRGGVGPACAGSCPARARRGRVSGAS
ncbi:hypothetical protein GCM10010238_22010 [Streptomyces griseoviridis]|uniref:Uncharacterized protein n=1 Tax=Streptomyces griseoviridis TaxID=45398 RepID=A0A918GFE1_STRGD|nr:hypothetical protein GCM10010238_22010 [Streptomyces niveoruber]